MKVVFLDIDGVLNCHRTAIAYGGVSWSGEAGIRAKMDEVAIRLIGGIVRLSEAKIVLSSSWRKDANWQTIGPSLGLEISDRTPTLLGSRGQEIAQWLAGHPEVERYAIIDDDSDMLDDQRPYFVHTSNFDGFNWANALRLAELMGVNIFDVNRADQRLPEPSKVVPLQWSDE